MAITIPQPASHILTYEDYLAEGEVEGRYDIIEGVRRLIPGPTWRHQRIADKITRALLQYEETTRRGMALSAPFDVLIRRAPRLQTRQPDVLFVSHEQLAKGGGLQDTGILEVAPELIVEIVSDSETERSIADKLADYGSIGVQEAWLVHYATRTVEILGISPNGTTPVVQYTDTQSLQSRIFPDLSLPVADFFQ
jgi:Uma2 family endonuclease